MLGRVGESDGPPTDRERGNTPSAGGGCKIRPAETAASEPSSRSPRSPPALSRRSRRGIGSAIRRQRRKALSPAATGRASVSTHRGVHRPAVLMRSQPSWSAILRSDVRSEVEASFRSMTLSFFGGEKLVGPRVVVRSVRACRRSPLVSWSPELSGDIRGTPAGRLARAGTCSRRPPSSR